VSHGTTKQSNFAAPAAVAHSRCSELDIRDRYRPCHIYARDELSFSYWITSCLFGAPTGPPHTSVGACTLMSRFRERTTLDRRRLLPRKKKHAQHMRHIRAYVYCMDENHRRPQLSPARLVTSIAASIKAFTSVVFFKKVTCWNMNTTTQHAKNMSMGLRSTKATLWKITAGNGTARFILLYLCVMGVALGIEPTCAIAAKQWSFGCDPMVSLCEQQ
jgi:hypothetical protein